jgi:hypothetical protein
MRPNNITEFLAKSVILRNKSRDEEIEYYKKILYHLSIDNCIHDVKNLPMCLLCKKYPCCVVCSFTNGLCNVCIMYCNCGGKHKYNGTTGISTCSDCSKQTNVLEN